MVSINYGFWNMGHALLTRNTSRYILPQDLPYQKYSRELVIHNAGSLPYLSDSLLLLASLLFRATISLYILHFDLFNLLRLSR